jgi:co-chaperonin GroES (HSP10)|tara:strand:+ start:371 stop:622 length:252 start_codon:yes stop_codon:yes gene_type:complete
MKAIGNYLIIEDIVEASKKTSGGLELAEKHDETRYKKGVIISAGPDSIQEKDKILYDKVAGHEVNYKDTIYKVISLKDVIAIL